jgi:hypothetical protein
MCGLLGRDDTPDLRQSSRAAPNVRDAHARTPLHVAAYGGHRETLRVLVARGADPNALEADMVRLLLQAGAR